MKRKDIVMKRKEILDVGEIEERIIEILREDIADRITVERSVVGCKKVEEVRIIY